MRLRAEGAVHGHRSISVGCQLSIAVLPVTCMGLRDCQADKNAPFVTPRVLESLPGKTKTRGIRGIPANPRLRKREPCAVAKGAVRGSEAAVVDLVVFGARARRSEKTSRMDFHPP